MAPGIVKLAEDEYVEWSTVVDCPVSFIHDRRAAVIHWGEDRVARTDANGHSWRDMDAMTPARAVGGNRAGPDEWRITLAAIRRRYRSVEAFEGFVLEDSDKVPCRDCSGLHGWWVDCPPAPVSGVVKPDGEQ